MRYNTEETLVHSARLEALKCEADAALRLFIDEGNRFWTRFHHWLVSNSVLAAALGVVVSSNSILLSVQFRQAAMFYISLTACGLCVKWQRIAKGGRYWHSEYGRLFEERSRQFRLESGAFVEPLHPAGLFVPEGEGVTGIGRVASEMMASFAWFWGGIALLAVVWFAWTSWPLTGAG